MQVLGERIKHFLAEGSVSQASFAERLGVSRSRLCNYINGRSEPNCATLCAMADLMQISLDELLGHAVPTKASAMAPVMQPELVMSEKRPAPSSGGQWRPLWKAVFPDSPLSTKKPAGWYLDPRTDDFGVLAPYALLIQSEALSPFVVPGDIVFVQPRFYLCPYVDISISEGLCAVRLSAADSVGLTLCHCTATPSTLLCSFENPSFAPVEIMLEKVLHQPITGKASSLWRIWNALPEAGGRP